MAYVKKPPYSEQLRDPRWQKLRLEVMDRDNWTCDECGDSTKTLNVHHGFYSRRFLAWEYPRTSLVTLCEHCHDERQHQLEAVHYLLAHFSTTELKRLFDALGPRAFGECGFVESLKKFCKDAENGTS